MTLEVASSTPGREVVNSGKLFTHMCLCNQAVSLAICHPSGCTVVSGVVVGVCNHSQMRTSKCTCLIFGVSIGLDPDYKCTKGIFDRSKFKVTCDITPMAFSLVPVAGK